MSIIVSREKKNHISLLILPELLNNYVNLTPLNFISCTGVDQGWENAFEIIGSLYIFTKADQSNSAFSSCLNIQIKRSQ